jgi:hypothetical protein
VAANAFRLGDAAVFAIHPTELLLNKVTNVHD